MKKLTGFLVAAAFLVFPLCANAGIVGNVNLTNYFSDPTGSVSFNSGASYGGYYLDYDVRLNGSGPFEAFCVENTPGAGNGSVNPYTLLSIDTGLSAFGLMANRHLAAGWIAQTYSAPYTMNEAQKASAQIAVWEVIFDGIGVSSNLVTGSFRSNTIYDAGAGAILDALAIITLPTSISGWALAVNPVYAGSTIGVSPYQNYLVPVPIPPTVLLLGAGVLGMIGLRRKVGK
jgi:hypothetical protein